MRVKTMLWGVLAGGLLLAGCQLPFGQKSQGFQLTLNFSSPSLRAIETTSRVLLPTATIVTLTVDSEGKTLDTQTVSTAGQSAVTFILNLPPLATYDLKAEARNAGGTLVFAGSTSVKLVGNVSGTLNLFPVDASGSMTGWTAVTATPANQPAGASVAQSLALNAGESLSFLLDWGNGSAFTFETTAGLEIYLQTTTGSPVTIPSANQTVQKSAAPGNAWITYYAPSTSVALSTLGQFTIPVQSLTLTGPTDVLTSGTGTVSFVAGSITPSNTTETAADFTWSTDRSDILDLGAAGAGGLPFTAKTVEGDAVITAVSKANPSTTATWTVKVTAPPPSGTVSVGFTTAPFEVLDFGPAVSLAVGDSLTVLTSNTTLQSSGTAWEWLLDGVSYDVSAEPLAWSTTFANLPAGLHTLSVGVTLSALRYSGTLSITVNPLEAVQ